MSALQKQKYLTVAGLIYAMAGATENHNLISGNIFFQLRSASRGKDEI
jgi:hypothetical protein